MVAPVVAAGLANAAGGVVNTALNAPKDIATAVNGAGNTQTSTQDTTPTYTPDQEANIQQAGDLQKSAVTQGVQGAQGVANATNAAAQPYVETAKNVANKDGAEHSQQLTYEQIQARLAEAGRALEASQKNINALNAAATVDPRQIMSRFFSDDEGHPDMGKKLLFGLSMMLSGIGSGLTGQPNLAEKAFQTQLQQAIDAKATTYKQKLQGAQAQQGQANTNAAVAQAAAAANQAAQGGAHTLVGTVANAMAMNLQSATAQANAKMVGAQFMQNGAQGLLNVAQMYKGSAASGTQQQRTMLGDLLMNVSGSYNQYLQPTLNLKHRAGGQPGIPGISAPDDGTPQLLFSPEKQSQEQPQIKDERRNASESALVNKLQNSTQPAQAPSASEAVKTLNLEKKRTLNKSDFSNFYGK